MRIIRKGRAAQFLLTLSLALLAGCAETNSEPSGSYTTSSIYAYMKSVQDESGAVATTVELRNGPTDSASYLYLSEGESLFSSLDVPPGNYFNYSENLFDGSLDLSQHLKIMTNRHVYTDYLLYDQIVIGSTEYYSLDTPHTGTSPTRSYVAFERSGQLWAGESSIVLPPAFHILSPVSYSTLTRAAPVVLSWSNTDPETTMELEVAGVCGENRYTRQPTLLISTDTNTGISSATLNSSDYFDAAAATSTTTCQVAFLLRRVRSGPVSAAFAFGSFRGIQQRTLQFTSIE